MKKFLALMFAMTLALSAAMAVSAESQEILTKEWEDAGGKALTTEGTYPAVELTFEVISKTASDYSNAAYSDPTAIPDVTIIKASDSETFYIDGIDKIDGVGLFKYTIVEVDPNVAGVTSDDTEYVLSILLTYVEDSNNPGSYKTDVELNSINVVSGTDTENKIDTIVNIYEVSSLSIDKTVTGNLSNKEDEFTVTVTFESENPVLTDIIMPDQTPVSFTDVNGVYTATEEITISDNSGVLTINGIPAGVQVTVEETDTGVYTLESYNVDGSDKGTAAQAITIGEADVVVVITNEYSTEIDTGISIESTPYIIILLTVICAAVYFVIRRRVTAEVE